MRCGGGCGAIQANSHDLRASNSLHGVLGLKLAGDGAVRGRLGAIQAAAPTVFRCDTQVMLCSGFDHQSPKRRVSPRNGRYMDRHFISAGVISRQHHRAVLRHRRDITVADEVISRRHRAAGGVSMP